MACPCPQSGQVQGIAPTKCQRFFNRYKLYYGCSFRVTGLEGGVYSRCKITNPSK